MHLIPQYGYLAFADLCLLILVHADTSVLSNFTRFLACVEVDLDTHRIVSYYYYLFTCSGYNTVAGSWRPTKICALFVTSPSTASKTPFVVVIVNSGFIVRV